MKKKQVLALLLAVSLTSSNMIQAAAADLNFDPQNGNLTLIEQQTDLAEDADSKNNSDTSEKTEKTDQTEKSEKTEETGETGDTEETDEADKKQESDNEKASVKKAEAKVKSSKTSQLSVENPPQVGDMICVFEKNYQGDYRVLSKDTVCLEGVYQIDDDEGFPIAMDHISVPSKVTYEGQEFQVTEVNLMVPWAMADDCKTLTFAEGIKSIKFNGECNYNFAQLEVLNIPSTCSDFELTDRESDGTPYEDFYYKKLDGASGEWTREQWVGEIRFPNGSSYYEIRVVNGDKRIYASTEETVDLEVGDTFRKGAFFYEVTEKNKQAKVVKLTGEDSVDLVVNGSVIYKGHEYKISTVELGEDSTFWSAKSLIFEEGIQSVTIDKELWLNEIKTLIFPASLNYLYAPYLTRNFTHLESLQLNDNASCGYKVVDNVLYSEDLTELVAFPAMKEADTFTVPSHVKVIKKLAFNNVAGIKHLIVPNTVETVEDTALYMMPGVENMEINAKNIGMSNAGLCDKLKTLKVNYNSDLKYGFGSSNPELTDVYLSGDITGTDPESFLATPKLKEYHVSDSRTMKAIDGVLYDGAVKLLAKYPSDKAEDLYVIPTSVKDSNSYAIRNTNNLKAVVVPKGMFLGSGMIYNPNTPIDVYISDNKSLNTDQHSVNFYASKNGGNLCVPNKKILDQVNNFEFNGHKLTDGVDVSVKVIPADSLTAKETKITIGRKDSKTVGIDYTPVYATAEAVWTSENPAIATVDENGTITGVKGGDTKVTVQMGDKKATIDVHVNVPLESILIDRLEATINKGETIDLSVNYNPEDTTDDRTITWSSNKPSVATVDENGVVTAIGAGEATITATAFNGLKATCKVTVKAPLKSISLDKTEATIHRGEDDSLKVTYNPTDTTDSREIRWESDNKEVATVDANGNVHAVGIGTAKITAHGANNTSATCEITVDAPLKTISVKEETTIHRGESETLKVTYNPDDTTDSKDVTWESDNKEVATVKDGKVEAVGIGTATITVKGANGTVDTCKVTVDAPIKSIQMNKESDIMNRDDSQKLSVTFNPDDTTDSKTLTWKSSDNSILTVDKDGNVNAVAIGTATITATSVNGKETTCKITVKAPLKSITLDRTTVNMNRGGNDQLKVTFNPDDTTDSKELKWVSSDKDIVSVDENGKLTAKGIGTATITVTGANGTKAVCEVTVKAPLESIQMNKEADTMNRGDSQKLSVTFNPDDTTDSKKLAWTSSDDSVATVSADGIVTAVNPGTATIKAQGVNNTVTTCKITVKAPLESISLDKEVMSIVEGSSESLQVFYNPADTTDAKDVTWTSSNDTVAAVKDGKVSALKVGTTTITAKVGSKTASCQVTVTRKEIALDSIELDVQNASLDVEGTKQLKVTYNPTNTTVDKTVTWSTSDHKVVTVENGLVTAVGEGTATVTAEVAGKKASCTFTVKAKEIALENIALDKTELSMTEKETEKLTVSYNPSNTTVDKTVTWSTSNNAVATVANDGTVTAVAPGTAVITAKVGSKTAECKVTVARQEIALESIALDKADVKLDLTNPGTEKLTVSYNPTNTTVDRTVTWKSSDEAVAKVDKDGKVTPVGVGEAVITATVAGKTATCKVTVVKNEVALESIKLDKSELNFDLNGTVSDTLHVTYNPSNTTVDKTVTWSTSDKEVVTVDENGNVKAVGVGEATIKAVVAGKEAVCTVKVTKTDLIVESITLDTIEAAMKKGESMTLHADVKANKEVAVTWTSSDENVLIVDENGKVTAVGAGEATITATAGDKSAVCKVVVSEETSGEDKPGTGEDKPGTGEDKPGTDKPSTDKPGTGTQKPGAGNNHSGNGNSGSASDTDSNTVKTGDPTQLGLLGALLAASGAVVTKLGLRRRRREDDEE